MELKLNADNYERQEQAMVDNFVNALGRSLLRAKEDGNKFDFSANANAEIDNLQQELIKKSNEQAKEQDEILRLSYDVNYDLRS